MLYNIIVTLFVVVERYTLGKHLDKTNYHGVIFVNGSILKCRRCTLSTTAAVKCLYVSDMLILLSRSSLDLTQTCFRILYCVHSSTIAYQYFILYK